LIAWLRDLWRRGGGEISRLGESPSARQALIEEKEAVLAEMQQIRRALDSERAGRRDMARIAALEQRLESLAPEEQRLRLLIDRTG